MSNILYIGEFDFNRKAASAVRIINNCKAILVSGKFNISIIGYSDRPNFKEGEIQIQNVKRGKTLVAKVFYYIFRPIYIIKLLQKVKVDVIIFYGASARLLVPLFVYCKVMKIKLIVDVIEWYDYSNLPLGRFGPRALDVHFNLTKLIPKCDGVIAISSYLQKYFINKGIETIRVPILIDSTHINDSEKTIPHIDQNFLNLIYAGVPGQKDLLYNIIEAVEQLVKEGALVRFHVLGPTKQQLQVLIRKNISDAIICYGTIAQEDVSVYLKQADFSVLLRPNKRYANAGFPTKFVESLSSGLPVIANYTSDLQLYLKDGYNGFVVEDYTTKALILKLKFILAFEKSTFSQLKIGAFQTALEKFDYRLYSDNLVEFITHIQQKI